MDVRTLSLSHIYITRQSRPCALLMDNIAYIYIFEQLPLISYLGVRRKSDTDNLYAEIHCHLNSLPFQFSTA